ncbi:MAG TPA: hypothetical protein VEZ15_12235, partial [Acidimicrobiia bacterium]|nr:hypothetical protein [Acidimicrobiia bacterium]
MRRTISIVVAAVLTIAVVATIVVAVSGGSPKRKLVIVRGAIDSEKKAFFDDPRVKAVFAKHGFDVQVVPAGSRAIATTFDLSKYDFAFLAGSPAAEKIRTDRKITVSYVPFFTPMVIATFMPIAQLLARAGVAHDRGGSWTLDVKGFLHMVKNNTRWDSLPGNTTYPSTKYIFITS